MKTFLASFFFLARLYLRLRRDVLMFEVMFSIRRILVPVDFGPGADAAIERAIEWARALDAEITLVHVFEAPVFAYPRAPYVAVDELVTALETSARSGLEALVIRAKARYPRVDGVLRQGSTWREINATAKELGADLVCMSSHGRTGLSRALIGSVAEKIVRTSEVPVLIEHVPPHEAPPGDTSHG